MLLDHYFSPCVAYTCIDLSNYCISIFGWSVKHEIVLCCAGPFTGEYIRHTMSEPTRQLPPLALPWRWHQKEAERFINYTCWYICKSKPCLHLLNICHWVSWRVGRGGRRVSPAHVGTPIEGSPRWFVRWKPQSCGLFILTSTGYCAITMPGPNRTKYSGKGKKGSPVWKHICLATIHEIYFVTWLCSPG